MVSYEEAVANLQQAYDMLRKADDNGVKMTNHEVFACQCAVKDALSFMEEPVRSEWISVKDRLPERPEHLPREIRREWYLVALESGSVISLGFEFDDQRWHATGSPVTHWMPLPKHPAQTA